MTGVPANCEIVLSEAVLVLVIEIEVLEIAKSITSTITRTSTRKRIRGESQGKAGHGLRHGNAIRN